MMRFVFLIVLLSAGLCARVSPKEGKSCRKEMRRECKQVLRSDTPVMECHDVEHEVCQVCSMEQREECAMVEEPHTMETTENVCQKVPSTTCQTVTKTVYEEVPKQNCVEETVPVCEEVPVRKCEMKQQPQETVSVSQECRPVSTQVPPGPYLDLLRHSHSRNVPPSNRLRRNAWLRRRKCVRTYPGTCVAINFQFNETSVFVTQYGVSGHADHGDGDCQGGGVPHGERLPDQPGEEVSGGDGGRLHRQPGEAVLCQAGLSDGVPGSLRD